MPSVLLALVYNNNGIATWTFEAARGLRAMGCPVWIAYRKPATLPADLLSLGLEVEKKNNSRSLGKKLSDKLSWYGEFVLPVQGNAEELETCLELLSAKGIIPDVIVLNQTSLVIKNCRIPQWVAGRAWPNTLNGYLAKITDASNLSLINRLHDQLYWYKMDNKGYRLATGVLAITEQLTKDLRKEGINVSTVYPGSSSAKVKATRANDQVIKFVSAALQLEDKRKNIGWMINQLAEVLREGKQFDLTLIGDYSADFKKRVEQQIPQVVFTGKLERDTLLKELGAADIFLFASLQENWGYVLVEAMAQGLAVLAPSQFPFTEIVERPDFLFKPYDGESFRQMTSWLLLNPIHVSNSRNWFYDRYQNLFSQQAFAASILSAIELNKKLTLSE